MPTLNLILKTFKLDQYNCILDISFLGGGYGLYIVGGYLIREKIIKKIKTKWLVFTSILFFIISCYIQIFELEHKIEYNIWYNSPFIFICTFALLMNKYQMVYYCIMTKKYYKSKSIPLLLLLKIINYFYKIFLYLHHYRIFYSIINNL